MQAFGFDLTDLEANRRGELSPRQRAHLNNLCHARRWWGLQTLGIVFGIQAAAFVLVWASGNLRPDDLRIGGPIILTGYTFLVIVGLLASRRQQRHLRAGIVREARGKARLHQGETRYGRYHQLRLGRRRFDLMGAAEAGALQTGAAYRVYFIAVTPAVILSIEPLTDPRAAQRETRP